MTIAVTSEKPSIFAVFGNRNFKWMWIGQTISDFGNGITSIAASVLVFRETGSALSVGLMLIATALPGLLFGLIAGVFVDRMDRKRIMVGGEMLRTIIILLIPVLLPYGIWWLYILVMLASTIDQFFAPAHASVLPDVASDEELAAANSFLTVSHTGALGLGFAAAGLITGRFPVEYAFYLDALTFFLSGMAIWMVQLPPNKVEEETSVAAVIHNLKTGARFLFDAPILRSLFITTTPMAILFGLHNALLLPFAHRALKATEFEYGLIEGLSMIGFVVGGMWMVKLADRLREGQWLAISFISMGLATVIYSQLTTVSLAIAIGIISALCNVPSYLARRLIIQRNTTREVRGRVTSAFFVTRDFLFVVGMGAAALADYFDVRLLYLLEGLLLALTGVVALGLPGLGQPAAEWRRALTRLRGIADAPGLGIGRSVTIADLDLFANRLPAFANLSLSERQQLMTNMRFLEAEPGTAIVRHHEISDAAYFILEGRAVAGREENGNEKVLEILNAGDFFGEIAALTGIPRTANVVVDEAATLLKVPADTLRQMAGKPELNRIFMNKMTERMIRMNLLDIPRIAGPDQALMKELRREEMLVDTPTPTPMPA